MDVLPLCIEESYGIQKCILPKDRFPPNARPGCWAKITISSKMVSLCRVFRRSHTNCAYLDTSVVTHLHRIEDEQSLEGQKLEHIECLDVTTESLAGEIEVILLVSEQLFRLKKLSGVTLTSLMDASQAILQSIHILPECTVRMPEFFECGIKAIQVFVHCALPNTIYYVNEYTCLIVKDVQLYEPAYKICLNSNKLSTEGFEAPYRELQDILHLAQIKRPHMPLNALLVGGAGSGKSTLIARFMQENKCNCLRAISRDFLGQYPGATESRLRRIFQIACAFQSQLKPQAPTVILFERLDLLCPAISTRNKSHDSESSLRICGQLLALLDDLIRSHSGIICIATTTSSQAIEEQVRRRFENEITITSLKAENRKKLFEALWIESYVGKNPNFSLNQSILDFIEKQTQGYVIGDLALLVQSLNQYLIHTKEPQINILNVLKNILNKSQPIAIRGSDVHVMRITEGFDSIGGMQDLKRILEITVLAPLRNARSFQRFGLTAPRGLLLYGPPGCAKTSIAKSLAAEANYNFISVTGAEVYSPYLGCAEKFITKIFDTARRNAPCIIFLDEIDSLAGRRKTGCSDVQIRILSTLLTEMDGIDQTHSVVMSHVLIVAATNRPNMVDEALLRPGRFDKLLHVPAPDYISRLSILRLYQQCMPLGPDVNLCTIAERTVNFSGADLCCLCNEAAINAFQSDFDAAHIVAKNFENVLNRQKSSLSQKQIDWFNDFEKHLHA